MAVAVSASVSIAADSDSDLSQRHTQNFGHTQRQRQSVSSPTRLTSAAQVLKPPTKLGKFRRSGEKETKSTAICLTADKTVKTGYHGTISYISIYTTCIRFVYRLHLVGVTKLRCDCVFREIRCYILALALVLFASWSVN